MTSRPASPSFLPAVPWYMALGQRIAALWLVKMIGTTLGISGFFFLYFWVMHNPPSEPTVMPLTPLDHWVGVSDDAMLLYGSLWFYISLAPALAKDKAELWACARDAAIMAAVGLVVFWLFPTTVPVFPVDWAQYPALQFLKATDVGGNAFPSLHVAFAVLTAVLLGRQLRSVKAPAWTHAVNVLWSLGIVYSTLATRQHVLIDVLGGTLLAGVISWAGTTRDWLVWNEA
ncbi:phosphatase PAP2 family protein [Variovorax sp. GB1P17]|uniref:phosphatase PAP2 family protein n=1 Tax=Variovorax sp. GB1P17 TaxID=3443740 RepID=UPI003F46DFC2